MSNAGFGKKSWLVTGGAGFLGTSFIRHLLKMQPASGIRVLDNLFVGTRQDLSEVCEFMEVKPSDISGPPEGVELVVGDVVDPDACSAACKGVEIVLHLAANTGVEPSVRDPGMDMRSNVVGTFNTLEAARLNGVERFIFASSGAPVGEAPPPIHENTPPRPVSPYGAGKLAGEAYCSAYYRTFGLKTVALRFGNVYGTRSGHKSSVVAKFIKAALSGGPLEIYGDGEQTRDFIYIDDLLNAIMLCTTKDVGGEVFQIATCRETSVNEIARIVSRLVREKTGNEVDIIHTGPRLGDVRRNFSDISKARRILGFEPAWTIEQGIEETLRWFLNERHFV